MSNRSICVTLAIIVSLTGCAAPSSNSVVEFLAPTPASLVFNIGKWIFLNDRKVFEVNVQGRGATEEQARQNAFRTAVEQSVGSLNLRQSERVDNNIIQDKQLIYSSGFVEKYKDLKVERLADDTWTISMTVWVKPSNLADGLIGKTQDTSTIDGIRQSNLLDSRDHERQTATDLLRAVLSKWPGQGVTIERPHETEIHYSADRNAVFVIPYLRVFMSEKYSKSLHEVLGRIGSQNQPRVAMYYNDTPFWRQNYPIHDLEQDRLISQTFQKSLFIRARAFDVNRIVVQRCLTRVYLYAGTSQLPTSTQSAKYFRNLSFVVTNQQLKSINRVEIDIVTEENMCR